MSLTIFTEFYFLLRKIFYLNLNDRLNAFLKLFECSKLELTDLEIGF